MGVKNVLLPRGTPPLQSVPLEHLPWAEHCPLIVDVPRGGLLKTIRKSL